MPDVYAALDCFAFASHSETQGMVLTEALAAGVPVVALDDAVAREVVRDGLDGRVVEGGRVEDLAEGLAWLTADETRAVAAELGVPEAEVTRMESRLAGSDLAYDGAATDNDSDPTAPLYYLADESSDPADLVAAEDWANLASEGLGVGLERLDARSRDIVQSRWLTDEKATLQELADRYHVSAERIRQLEKNALAKLKDAILAA
jgi:DNA-directed RNA polymerase sigma subunit (sigma70/sigma32)